MMFHGKQDHPRRCGENVFLHFDSFQKMGSPPQVRGKLWGRHGGTWYAGITPAGAGKTSRLAVLLPTVEGSPPQVRGKQRYAHGLHRRRGITPAGAGKTFKAVIRSDSSQDHPRRCGENVTCECKFAGIPGSPPQVRGKLLCWFCKNCLHRITPAGAGKTLYWLSRWAVCRDHPRRCGENI